MGERYAVKKAMKIYVLYLRIVKKWSLDHPEHKSYSESSDRFLKSYNQFMPQTEHKLIVVNCGGEKPDSMFDGIASDYLRYDGGGYDCGTYQHIGKELDCDLAIGLNTHAYLWKHLWLEPFQDAASKFGVGVYGATASYEQNPHLRTPAIAFSPKVILEYPIVIDSRERASHFEAGPNNFSLWAKSRGYVSILVACDGVYGIEAWRMPKNIFRRGNQSNCLILDRHTDIYRDADPATKKQLEMVADNPKHHV